MLEPSMALTEKSFLSISEAADLFSVSSATIRNWIKTGHLNLIEKGKIDQQSILTFQEQLLGKEKLNGRANKSQKDSHDHAKLALEILSKLDKSDLEKIGEEYENQLSNAYRNKEGVYYTPKDIVEDLLNITEDISEKTF